MLRDFALKRYEQENHTIFGHGEGNDLLKDEPMINPGYETFLDGTFMDTDHLPHRTYGQHLYIKHMQSKIPEGVGGDRCP